MQLVEILEMYIDKLCNTSILNKKDNSNDLSLIDEAVWHTAFILYIQCHPLLSFRPSPTQLTKWFH